MLRLIPTQAVLLLTLTPGMAQETTPSELARDADSPAAAADLETLAEFTVPGEPHEVLAGTVGTWDLTIRTWRTPEGEPLESRGSAVGRWILGERFVETTYSGSVMDKPFEGLKIEGYDKVVREYVSTWRDNLGTYTIILRGSCDSDCSKRTLTGQFMDPVSRQQLTIKGVTTLTTEDSYLYESFIVTPAGGEFKNMELEAERRAP